MVALAEWVQALQQMGPVVVGRALQEVAPSRQEVSQVMLYAVTGLLARQMEHIMERGVNMLLEDIISVLPLGSPVKLTKAGFPDEEGIIAGYEPFAGSPALQLRKVDNEIGEEARATVTKTICVAHGYEVEVLTTDFGPQDFRAGNFPNLKRARTKLEQMDSHLHYLEERARVDKLRPSGMLEEVERRLYTALTTLFPDLEITEEQKELLFPHIPNELPTE